MPSAGIVREAWRALARRWDISRRPLDSERLVAYLNPSGRELPPTMPTVGVSVGVLSQRSEWEAATAEVLRLGLPRHVDPQKNWDTIGALRLILATAPKTAKVLDAGGEFYSTLLPSLFLYGYSDLHCINLAFKRQVRRGPITYDRGDVTATPFVNASLDAMACLSVIEHGVDPARFFQESARILKKGGLLILSTDYWHDGVDTSRRQAFGEAVHVFTYPEIQNLIALALEEGFELLSPFNGRCVEKAVRWADLDLEYTFAILSFKRT